MGIACGVEAMSRVPLGANVGTEAGTRRPDVWAIDMPDQFGAAERIARRRGITREDVDAFGFALAGDGRRRRGPRAGSTARSLPVDGPGTSTRTGVPTGENAAVARDQGLRETTIEGLAEAEAGRRRRHPHRGHLVADLRRRRRRAADGRRPRARRKGLRPRARIVAQVLVGAEPDYHLDGPVEATRKCSSGRA